MEFSPALDKDNWVHVTDSPTATFNVNVETRMVLMKTPAILEYELISYFGPVGTHTLIPLLPTSAAKLFDPVLFCSAGTRKKHEKQRMRVI